MIKELYRKMIPIGIRYAVAQKRDKKNNAKSLEKLEKIYADSAYDKRYQNEIEWIVRNKRIEVFPYEWVKEYDDFGTEVFTDKELKMKYVLHNGKRLYFPKGYSAKFIQRYYRSLVVEQDKRSAHHYLSDDEQCIEGSVFVDVGAAEGIISLNVVDKAEKIVMFECNDAWLEALNATFAPWKEKIQIIRKFAGNCDNENMISLDKYFEDPSNITATVVAKIRGKEQIVEVTIPLKGFLIRCEESHDDLYAAIDIASDKIERQIRKNKTRMSRKYKDENIGFNFDVTPTLFNISTSVFSPKNK